MGGAIYKDAPAIKYEERNIYLNSIQTLGRYLTPSRLNYSCLLPPPPPPPHTHTHTHTVACRIGVIALSVRDFRESKCKREGCEEREAGTPDYFENHERLFTQLCRSSFVASHNPSSPVGRL